ncbi:unnamed protein product [Adineta ricciae]|uniref:Uncharacterized protein n=1 Tax=Adineta ricciae TaxID=249248 RepID=A0A815ES86_ADIRI|nr:unnamed protein product [Adineta ricciae]
MGLFLIFEHRHQHLTFFIEYSSWFLRRIADHALVTRNYGAAFQVPTNYRLLAKTEFNESYWLTVDDIVAWLGKLDTEMMNIDYDLHLTHLFKIKTVEELSTTRIAFDAISACGANTLLIEYALSGYRIDALLQQYLNAYHYASNRILVGHVSHGQCVIKGGVVISDSSTVSSRIPIRLGMIITLELGIYVNGE